MVLPGQAEVRILAPFRHIPVHIVQAPGIGLLQTNRMGASLAVSTLPGVVAELLFVVEKAIPRLGPGPAGIFPLGLGW